MEVLFSPLGLIGITFIIIGYFLMIGNRVKKPEEYCICGKEATRDDSSYNRYVKATYCKRCQDKIG